MDATIQADLHDQPTGVYPYALTQGLRGFTGSRFIGTSATLNGQLINVNESASPLGSGWSLAGIMQLVANPDGSVLLVDGDGTDLLYNPGATAGTYVDPSGDFATLQRLADSTFRRTLTDGSVEVFDAAGKLASVTDRNGNVTLYAYDTAGNLARITDPVGLQTIFAYANGHVVTITDPAGRQTTLSYDARGQSDPDRRPRRRHDDPWL